MIALAGATIGRDAVAEVLGVVDGRLLRALLAATLEGRAAEALRMVGEVASAGADLHAFLDDLTAEARAALVVSLLPEAGASLAVPAADLEELAELGRLASPDDLRRLLDRLIEAGPRLRNAPEPRFLLEALAVRLAHLTRLEPLADILRDSDVIQNLKRHRETIKGPCRECDRAAECYGCRGAAFQMTGDYLASDPLCWNNNRRAN